LNDFPRGLEHERENKLRRDHATIGPGLQIDDELVEQFRHVPDASDVCFRVSDVVDLVDIDEKGRRSAVQAVHLIHRITIETKTEAFRVALRFSLEKFVAKLRLRIERVEIEIAF
jgi:hypothetical protein